MGRYFAVGIDVAITKLAIEQLTKSRGRLFAAITVMALGIAIMTSISMIIDTMEAGFVAQEEYLYGNIHYTAYNPAGNYADNNQYTIPGNLTSAIRSIEGVTAVTARKGRIMGFCSGANVDDFHNDYVFGIDVDNPDEVKLGRGIVIDCMAAFGSPDTAMLEALLSTSIVTSPCVISDAIARDFGWYIGDIIKPSCENYTRAYATATELASVANGTLDASVLEQNIAADKTRWKEFTVVGVFLDGSEAIEKPIPHKENSLNTITPKPRTVYFRLNDTMQYIYNANPGGIAYYLISGEINADNIDALVPYAIFDIRESVQGFIDYSMLITRALLIVLSMISLLVCAYMIKAVIEFNLEERKKEMGLMLALGFNRNKITQYVTTQIVFISAIATGIGFCLGLVLPLNIDTRTMIQFLSYNKVYEVAIEMPVAFKTESILLVIGFGMIFPLIQGLTPLKEMKQWNIIEMMNPEHVSQTTILSKKITEPHESKSLFSRGKTLPEKEKRKQLKKITQINSRQMKAKRALIPIALMILGLAGVFYACLNSFPEQSYSRLNFSVTWIYLVILGCGGGLFIISLLHFSRELIASLTAVFTRNPISRRYLKEMNDYVPKRVYQSSMNRNQSNLTTALIITTTLVVSFLVVYSSAMVGDVKTNRSKLGGDVVIFDPPISDEDLIDLRASVTGIAEATLVDYILMSGWRYNAVTQGILVNSIDGVGGRGMNRSESMNVVCIEPSSFIKVNPESDVIYDITNPLFTSGNDFVLKLNELNSILIQTKLLDDIGKSLGDSVEINIMGLTATLKIVGSCDFMPCAPQMAFMDTDQWITRTAFISRETLSQIVIGHFASTDIMVKNRTINLSSMTNETVSNDFLGYLSGQLNTGLVNASINTVPGIAGASFRFSTFAPSVPRITTAYDPARLIYQHPNATFGSNLTLDSRFYSFDPVQECKLNMGSRQERVLNSHPFIQFPLSNTYDGDIRVYNRTAAEMLYAFEHIIEANPFQRQTEQNIFNRTLACIVNKYVAHYESTTNLTYVHENRVGDILTVEFEGTGDIIKENFTVIGVIDTHYAYLHSSGTEQEPHLLSQRTINYDFNANVTSDSFVDIFDSESNVLFTSMSELRYLEFLSAKSPFGYSADALINHAYIKVQSGFDAGVVSNALNQAFSSAGLINVTAMSVKQLFLNKTARIGVLSIKLDSGVSEATLIQELREWYLSHGFTWRESAVGTVERMSIGSDIMIAEPLFNLLYTFAFVSALVSNISLCLIVFMYIKSRYREIGILKSMGFSTESIQRSIFTESFISNLTGQILGAGCGIGLIYLIMSTISSTLIIPFVFSVPVVEIVVVMVLNLAINLVSAYFNARQSMRRPVAEILKYE
jgi:ABC-type antimicrobial peptide transport system permease subunit